MTIVKSCKTGRYSSTGGCVGCGDNHELYIPSQTEQYRRDREDLLDALKERVASCECAYSGRICQECKDNKDLIERITHGQY
jgi:4-hydroxy-3-methylbut-2-enyl diphosphate reductase IspH